MAELVLELPILLSLNFYWAPPWKTTRICSRATHLRFLDFLLESFIDNDQDQFWSPPSHFPSISNKILRRKMPETILELPVTNQFPKTCNNS